VYTNMSAEEINMKLAVEIHEYLEPHATGKRRQDVHNRYGDNYERDMITDTLDHMVERKWILDHGDKIVWSPRP